MKNTTKTLVIDNFHGSMTYYRYGDINSGLADLVNSGGYDPFTRPGSLTWMESPVQIDSAGAVLTDMVMAGKTRIESGVTYVYAIGHTGRLYKIQVNDPTTSNPNYDNPVLLATLTSNTPTFTRGGFIDFFGSTNRIYIGHDKGVTRIDFNGTNETFVGILGSWTQTVPRPFVQFVGKLYVGNGSNFAEIDSTATVTSYAKLSPGFPTGTQVRDLDITPEGTYLQAIVADQGVGDLTSTAVNTTTVGPGNSYVFKWNGTDTGYTSLISYANTTLSSNVLSGEYQYIHGYDFTGQVQFNPVNKLLTSLPSANLGEIYPNSTFMIGNMLYAIAPLLFSGFSILVGFCFGAISEYDEQPGYWSPLISFATGTETDVIRSPYFQIVSNFVTGYSSDGYTNHIIGNSKTYFSTLETSASPTTKYKFYRWTPLPTGSGTPIYGSAFQTQRQLFSKKVDPSEVRIYGNPWVAGNSFLIDLIGPDDNPIPNASFTAVAGTNLTIGDDFLWYNPTCKPVYAIGLRITQLGTTNHVINKVEIDYDQAGK